MSDTDASFNFLISLAYSQMFNLLCEKADDEHGGRLPVHVRCLIDEFANIGQIPNFEKLIATIRSREISACIVLQAKSQLKSIYKDNADTIEGNCDTLLFLGGKEKTTLKEMEELLGKETIDTFNTGENRGREVSHSLNYQKLGKSLMSVDELAVMDGGKCILQLRGVRPFLSDKYDITAHPNYKYLSDANPKNAFHIENYLSRQLKLRLKEEFAAIEVDVSDSPEDEKRFWKNGRMKTNWRLPITVVCSNKGGYDMAFFASAVTVLQTLVVAIGAGLGIWGVINLLEGYGNDNPGANAHVR